MALGEKDPGRDKNREADKEEKSREEKEGRRRRREEAREIEARAAREKISVIGASLSGRILELHICQCGM